MHPLFCKKIKIKIDLCCKKIEFGLEKSNRFLRTWKILAFRKENFRSVLIKENKSFDFKIYHIYFLRTKKKNGF